MNFDPWGRELERSGFEFCTGMACRESLSCTGRGETAVSVSLSQPLKDFSAFQSLQNR